MMNFNAEYVEMRFLIPQHVVDVIIGPRRMNLDRLKGQYQVDIDILKSSSAECILTIGGYDIYVLCLTLEDVLQTITRSLAASECEMCMLSEENRIDSFNDDENLQIQQIVEETSCRIDFFPVSCPLSSERVVRVCGPPSTVVQSIYQLCSLLLYSPLDGSLIRCRRLYNASNADPSLVAEYGGYVQQIAVKESQTLIPRPIPVVEDQVAESVVKKFSLPVHLSEAVLGHSGVYLHRVCIESGAKVLFSDGIPGTKECVVTVSGNPEQVDNARLLLQMCIRRFCTQSQ